MDPTKYSYYYLRIESNINLEIIGSRKGLTPFVFDFNLIQEKNKKIIKEIILKSPYVQSNEFLLFKNEINKALGPFKDNFLQTLQENKKIFISIKWRPIEFLAHQLTWICNVEIVKYRNKLSRMILEIGQKKFKKHKKEFAIADQSGEFFNNLMREIIEIIKSRGEFFNPDIINWLID